MSRGAAHWPFLPTYPQRKKVCTHHAPSPPSPILPSATSFTCTCPEPRPAKPHLQTQGVSPPPLLPLRPAPLTTLLSGTPLPSPTWMSWLFCLESGPPRPSLLLILTQTPGPEELGRPTWGLRQALPVSRVRAHSCHEHLLLPPDAPLRSGLWSPHGRGAPLREVQ